MGGQTGTSDRVPEWAVRRGRQTGCPNGRSDGGVRPGTMNGRSGPVHYWVNEILICTPALVFTIGALDEIYGLTRRWSK